MHRDRKAWFEVGTLVRVFRRLGGGATMEIVQACLARQRRLMPFTVYSRRGEGLDGCENSGNQGESMG